jgi:hypothetical protein
MPMFLHTHLTNLAVCALFVHDNPTESPKDGTIVSKQGAGPAAAGVGSFRGGPHPGDLAVDLGGVLARADDEDGGEGREARRDVHHDATRKVHHLPPPARGARVSPAVGWPSGLEPVTVGI